MTYMGLDLSLTSTGVSVNGSTSTISTKLKGVPRLDFISNEVINICLLHNVKLVGIEGYSFSSRNSQAHSIGELGGVVRLRLWEKQIPFVEIPPTCRAKFATGRGNASKGEVISAVSAKTGIVFLGAGGNDECDAWILEQMLLVHAGRSSIKWGKDSLEALKKIDWSTTEGVVE